MLVIRPADSAAIDADERPIDELGENPHDAAGAYGVVGNGCFQTSPRSTGPPTSERRRNTASSASSSRAIVLSTTLSMSSVGLLCVVETARC